MSRNSRSGRSARIREGGLLVQGRPAFVPSEAHRRHVHELKLAGLKNMQIAEIFGIARGTLEKHYARELAMARVELMALLAWRAYELALAGDGAMIQFILRTQAGWVERQ